MAGAFLFFPSVSLAALTAGNTGLKDAVENTGLADACSGSQNCIATIVGRVVNAALGFVGIILLGLLLYAGFLWMTAGGEEEKVKTARGMIANAVAGILIIATAFAITSYVLEALDTTVGTTRPTRGTDRP